LAADACEVYFVHCLAVVYPVTDAISDLVALVESVLNHSSQLSSLAIQK
jgi:hypothetical protein